MSRVEGLPLDALVPIKDVNILVVRNAGTFIVEKNNENSGHRFIYKRVVNGLVGMTREHRPRRIYIIMIEVINNDDIPWSFITKVQNFLFVHVIYPWPPTHSSHLLKKFSSSLSPSSNTTTRMLSLLIIKPSLSRNIYVFVDVLLSFINEI